MIVHNGLIPFRFRELMENHRRKYEQSVRSPLNRIGSHGQAVLLPSIYLGRTQQTEVRDRSNARYQQLGFSKRRSPRL
ncbi:hypothetical protein D3C81_1736780 [compost metagenome]